jgi:glycosyltransferase involved in cell wall biosynthesis
MITLAIPSYNRSYYVIESFIRVLSDNRINEILIVDDNSSLEEFSTLEILISELCHHKGHEKIRLIRNQNNLGSFLNKKECVTNSKFDWVILLDSDNVIDVQYLNSIENKRDATTIYTPSHAICDSPILNYRKYSNTSLTKNEYVRTVSEGNNVTWDCILNTGNYFFNKINYLKCINQEPEVLESYAADAFYMIYLWMKNIPNAKLEVTEGMVYEHRLHSNSHWTMNSELSNSFVKNLTEKIIRWN